MSRAITQEGPRGRVVLTAVGEGDGGGGETREVLHPFFEPLGPSTYRCRFRPRSPVGMPDLEASAHSKGRLEATAGGMMAAVINQLGVPFNAGSPSAVAQRPAGRPTG